MIEKKRDKKLTSLHLYADDLEWMEKEKKRRGWSVSHQAREIISAAVKELKKGSR